MNWEIKYNQIVLHSLSSTSSKYPPLDLHNKSDEFCWNEFFAILKENNLHLYSLKIFVEKIIKIYESING